jgi:hypothetical protein
MITIIVISIIDLFDWLRFIKTIHLDINPSSGGIPANDSMDSKMLFILKFLF